MLNRFRGHIPLRYRGIAKFVLVGGVAYVLDTSAYFLMVHTFLPRNPITAGGISALLATILSYVLNSEWAFATRAVELASMRRRCSS